MCRARATHSAARTASSPEHGAMALRGARRGGVSSFLPRSARRGEAAAHKPPLTVGCPFRPSAHPPTLHPHEHTQRTHRLQQPPDPIYRAHCHTPRYTGTCHKSSHRCAVAQPVHGHSYPRKAVTHPPHTHSPRTHTAPHARTHARSGGAGASGTKQGASDADLPRSEARSLAVRHADGAVPPVISISFVLVLCLCVRGLWSVGRLADAARCVMID